MIPARELGRASVPGSSAPLILTQRGDDFEIRLGTHLLMQSRAHGSEATLADLACVRVAARTAPRVLIGGLGMGFTLAAALRALPADAGVVMAELVPGLVEWNRGPLAHLAGRPLDDVRVSVEETDVADLIRDRRDAFDAILLDVDNGPQGLTRPSNDALYSSAGLSHAHAALRKRGVLAVWSVAPDEAFTRRLRGAGFQVEEHVARARGSKGARHVIWIATRD